MKHRLNAIVPSLVLGALTLIYIATAMGYKADTRAVPMVVAGVTMLLVVLDLLSQGDGQVSRLLRRFFGGAAGVRPGEGGQSAPVAKEIAAFAWIFGFTFLTIVVGFYVAIPIYVFGYLRFYAGKSLIAAAGTGLCLTAVLYVTFELLLGYQIFEGLLFGGYM